MSCWSGWANQGWLREDKRVQVYRCPGCFVFADGIAVKLADEAAEVDQGDQSEPTLNDLKKGLDELKGIMTTKNMARGPSAQVSEKDCSTLSVMMSDLSFTDCQKLSLLPVSSH